MNLLITNKSNIRYLSNFTGSSGFMLITKSKKYLFTDFRYIDRAKDSIKKGITIIDTTRMWRNAEELKKNWHGILKKHRITKLGIEETDLTIQRFKQFKKISKFSGTNLKFTDISGKIEELREIKTPTEIKLIKKSQEINEKTFKEIKKIIQQCQKTKKSITEVELAWKIKEFGHHFGSEEVSFDPIVAFDTNSARPHHEPGQSKLKSNSIILIDMGMRYRGYCSDMTRTILPPKPSREQREVYDLVLEAQLNGIHHIKADLSGLKADALSRDIIDKAGYGEHYGHAGGHGIGLDIHESPALSKGYSKRIKANTVITVEPGIYLPGKFGVRIEDMILVKKAGNENLTKIQK